MKKSLYKQVKKNLYELYIYIGHTCVSEGRIWAENDREAIDRAKRRINRWWIWRYGDTPMEGKDIKARLWKRFPTRELIWSWQPEEVEEEIRK